MKRIDIMTDIETLGKGKTPCVFQIAACAFDIETGRILRTFNEIANITNATNIEGDTLLWWLKTNKELLAELLLSANHEHSYTEKDIVENFVNWFNELVYVGEEHYTKETRYLWGNGILFDNRIIKNKCSEYGINYPIFYRNDRDMRTLVELAAHKEGFDTEKQFRDAHRPKELIEHDGFADVKAQIYCLCEAYKIINK